MSDDGPRGEVDIKLGSTSLPKGDANGVAKYSSMLVRPENRKRMWVGLFILSVPIVEENADKNVTTGKARIRRVELMVDPSDASDLERILMRAYERRTGAAVLPLELEQDVEAAFEGLDPDAIAREMAALADERATAETENYLAQRERELEEQLAGRADEPDQLDLEGLPPAEEYRDDDDDPGNDPDEITPRS